MADASQVLHEFAIWCAETILSQVRDPDPRSLRAIEIKKLWLDGKATDEELKAARDAAWNAAWPYAWHAAEEEARGAAWGAAWRAARVAAGYAVTVESQNKELERSLLALHPH